MNQVNSQFLELARQNAAVHAANPKVRAILLVGSVARSLADECSDIDTALFFDELPAEGAKAVRDAIDPERRKADASFLGMTCRHGRHSERRKARTKRRIGFYSKE